MTPTTSSPTPSRLMLLDQDDLPARRLQLPDATDEYSAQDVLYMLQVATRARESTPSIAPVGIDLEPLDLTRQAELAVRRRKLSRYVVGAVAFAAAILVASLVKRTAADAPATEAPRSVRAEVVAPSPEAPPAKAHPAPAAAPPLATDATSGLVRFTTQPGWAWVDGQQLAATSAIVPCGPHLVQIGGEDQREVVVPCGGEVVVTR